VRLEQTSIAARSEGPKYDASYLEDLKAYTNSARPAPPPSNDEVHTMDVDSGMMLDASEMDGAFIENANELPLMSSAMATETMIPTESSIKAARDKRDRLRKTGVQDGAEEDFISLSVAKREDFAQGPHPESRLMREDDDLGEGDDGEYLKT
jgi:GC-rich sequence DNA-binding factor